MLVTFSLLGASALDRLTSDLVKQGYGTLLSSVLQTCLNNVAVWPKMYFKISRYSTSTNNSAAPRSRSLLESAYETIDTSSAQNHTFNGYLPWVGNASYNLVDTRGRVAPRALDPGRRNTVLGGGCRFFILTMPSKTLYKDFSLCFKTAHVSPKVFSSTSSGKQALKCCWRLAA